MEVDNVTLVVKAPNQQIIDQNIQCSPLWTVKMLKEHLSEVYPSKPKPQEQKIIYSGQLLEDAVVLKEILRTYEEGQKAHTVHLVCTPNRFKHEPNIRDEGVRRRNVPTQRAEEPVRADAAQNNSNYSQQNINNMYANYFNRPNMMPYPMYNAAMWPPMPAAANNPELANQMAAMQRNYVNYMQQYATMLHIAATSNPPLPPNWMYARYPEDYIDPPNNDRQPTTPNINVPPQPQQVAQPLERAIQQQNQAINLDELDNEEGNGGDWLETIYGASRVMILVLLIYFYSSPLRFALVLLLGFVLYLYEIGFFRNLNAPAQQDRVAVDVNMNENRQIPQQPEIPAENRAEAPENRENQPETPPPRQETPENATQQSVFAVTWMIVTSFLTSLIPEGPNAI